MKRTFICLVLLISGLLCGCSAHELEDRCFPMLALVDYDARQEKAAFCDTFPTPRRSEDEGTATEEIDTVFAYGNSFLEAWQQYEGRLSRESDYNHLKVLVIGEAFLENDALYQEMLDFFWESETLPRNVYVCVMQDTAELLEIQGLLSDDAGTYLEQFLEKNEEGGGYKIVTLGDLMDEQLNRREKLYLPYLAVEEKSIVWKAWYGMERGTASGIVEF